VNIRKVHEQFDANGKLLDPSSLPAIDKFLKELLWMARTLRYGREHVHAGVAGLRGTSMAKREAMICDRCGATMNHHAEKLVEPRDAGEAKRLDARAWTADRGGPPVPGLRTG
jgi:hypothetical protein